jgi:hypothetical protein
MENEYTFNFEFWDHKLRGVLAMFNALTDNYMPPIEFDLVEENLEATNFEDNIWTDLNINGKSHKLDLLLAKNKHEDRGSIVIMITTQEDLNITTEEERQASEDNKIKLSEQIKTLSLFQGLFKDLELE